MAPTVTLSRAAAVLHGVAPAALQGPALSAEAVQALAPILTARGFELTRPIYVRELPDSQGFASRSSHWLDAMRASPSHNS
jgi:hypothetical protein